MSNAIKQTKNYITEKIQAAFKYFELTSHAEKIFFVILTTLFFLYIQLCGYLKGILLEETGLFLYLINFFISSCAVIFSLYLFKKLPNVVSSHKRSTTKSLVVGTSIALTTFILLMLWRTGCKPGGFSPDSIDQYHQALSGQYNDWHPAIHTWTFFTLPLTLFGTSDSVIIWQLLLFSGAIGYLYYVLYSEKAHGCFLFITYMYLCLNPLIYNYLMYPWKDLGMTIFAIVLFSYLVRIYQSEGLWLKHPINIILFICISTLTALMRHNAILMVLPLYLIILFSFKSIRKPVICMFLAFLAFLPLIKGPIYTLAGVEKPGKRNIEFVGLPMTVLCSVYTQDPSALSGDALEFMNSLATPDEWKSYRDGNFNSIKYCNSEFKDKVNAAGNDQILKYSLTAFLKSPKIALHSVAKLTSFVWNLNFKESNYMPPDIISNSYGIEPDLLNENIRKTESAYVDFWRTRILNGLNSLGILSALLICLACTKIGNAGIKKVFILVSPLLYNWGTMLLLSGPDFRFFFYNFIIWIPVLFLILSKKTQFIKL